MTPEEKNSFRIQVRVFYDCLQERIDLDGRIGCKKDKTLKKNTPPRDEEILGDLLEYRDGRVELAKMLLKDISQIVVKEPLWTEFLQHITGVGQSMAAVILSEFNIDHIPKSGKVMSVSNLWSFAGLAPGKDRKKKGKKRPYNAFLREKLCGVLGASFLRSSSMPYRMYYDNEKTRLENSTEMVLEYPRKEDKEAHKKLKEAGIKPEERRVMWKDAYIGHRHKAAIRKMIKEFLKDLYVAWRTIEGLPVREPYSEEYLGKKPHKKVQGEAEARA